MLIAVPEGPGADVSIASAIDLAMASGGAFDASIVRDVAPMLDRGAHERRDVLLLPPGATIRAGMIVELRAVAATDPMIGFVDARAAGTGDVLLAGYLPPATYQPVTAGHCTLIRWPMLAEFGQIDDAFDTIAGAVADLAMRANRRGYRSVRANRATFDGTGGIAIDLTDGARLDQRHPALATARLRHANDPARRAERLVGALATAPAKPSILFDCRMMHAYYSGTCEHARQLLVAFVERHGARFDCHALVSDEGFRFHRLDAIAGLGHRSPDATDRPPFAVAFRLAQPFDLDALISLMRSAPVAGALMLDTIALDCQHLDEAGLDAIWSALADCAAVIGFNSVFSERQFAARFAIPAATTTFVSLCSTATADYAAPAPAGDGILLVGNHYPHKALVEMVAALTAAGAAARTTVLGVELDGVAASVHAGSLPQATVDALYDAAGVLLFASHYEGFGLPVMQALARRKPVIARDLPCLREIAARSPFGHNIHFAATTADLATLAAAPPAWDATPQVAEPEQDWGRAADALAEAFDAALARFDFDDCVRRQRIVDLLAVAREGAAALAHARSDLAARDAAIAERDAAVAAADTAREAAEAEGRASALRVTMAAWDARVDALALATMRRAWAVAVVGGAAPRRSFALPGRRRAFALTVEEAAALRAGIEKPGADHGPFEALLERLLGWASLHDVGAAIRIVLPGGTGDLAGPASDLVRAIGCRVDRVATRRGRIVADGTVLQPPPALPEDVADPVVFAQLCARVTLGRPADAIELGALLRSLADGEPRAAIWRRMTAYGMRLEFVKQRDSARTASSEGGA